MHYVLFVACVLVAAQASADGTPKPSKTELKQKLTDQQYSCTQENGTEAPFKNAYWNNHDDGIYVDVVSGEALFSSLDKFDSGSGWPSFTKPLNEDSTVEKRDSAFGMARTEVRSRGADSHLGHVFDDGPGPGGQRFCINSASLRFVPVDKLQQEGLGRYLFSFADKKSWDIATLAGGCFWGMQEILAKQFGVVATQVGYTGGVASHPTYEQVSSGTTGHAESLQILFDPKRITYESILLYFYRMHDPTSVNRQANDVGTQYRSAIFYRNAEQKRVAETVKTRVDQSHAFGKPVVTQINALGPFWRAEEYHQDYLEKHPNGYRCHQVRELKFGP
jgi:peptide methionine sulfoxide reductase msrA/msrB